MEQCTTLIYADEIAFHQAIRAALIKSGIITNGPPKDTDFELKQLVSEAL